MLNIFHVFVYHLYVFFGEMSVYFFGPFFDWVIYFSGVELEELLVARNLWALFNFSSQLGCPPRSENFPHTRQREGFLVVGNFLYWDSLPGTGLRPSFSCVPF